MTDAGLRFIADAIKMVARAIVVAALLRNSPYTGKGEALRLLERGE